MFLLLNITIVANLMKNAVLIMNCQINSETNDNKSLNCMHLCLFYGYKIMTYF